MARTKSKKKVSTYKRFKKKKIWEKGLSFKIQSDIHVGSLMKKVFLSAHIRRTVAVLRLNEIYRVIRLSMLYPVLILASFPILF